MSSFTDQLGFNFRPPERRIWKVRELVTAVRIHVERQYTDAWVEGEISNFRAPDSGHLYFTLKDGNAQIKVVMFRSAARLLRFRPADGLQALVRGRVTVYEDRGELQIAAEFIQNFDAKRERCWIVEREGAIVGSVFLVKNSDRVAKLRLLLVEPSARGLGIGGRLVDECIRFARQAGYRKITLWTQSMLDAARSIYRKAGFRVVKRERHRSFGHRLTGETWELSLLG